MWRWEEISGVASNFVVIDEKAVTRGDRGYGRRGKGRDCSGRKGSFLWGQQGTCRTGLPGSGLEMSAEIMRKCCIDNQMLPDVAVEANGVLFWASEEGEGKYC